MDLIRPTYLEIDIKKLLDNYRVFKKIMGENIEILSVIKANAYGHGMVEIAKALENEGGKFFGVATIEEGIFLRESGIKSKILILGSLYPFLSFEYIYKYDLLPNISSFNMAEKLNEFCIKKNIILDIHIKIDTGMSRIGININSSFGEGMKISKLSNLKITGIFSHIAKNDDDAFTNNQILTFNNLKNQLSNLNIKYFHIANTRTALEKKEARFNMVRIGIGLYGLIDEKGLEPILSLKTKIVFLKKVKKGTPISYDGTFITPCDSLIATIPIGYADGYSRLLSNQAFCLIKGKKVRQVGKICMDMCMLDVTDVYDVKVGDEVILIGKSGNLGITAKDLADKTFTINYEIVSSFTSRIPRIYKY